MRSDGLLVAETHSCMRLALGALVVLTSFALAACTATEGASDPVPGETVEPPTAPTTASQPAPPPASAAPGTPEVTPKPNTGDPTFPEVVYVFMTDHEKGGWMCTGTLVSRSLVVTAAHCLDPDNFASYEIVAPNAPGRPRVAASQPKIFGGTYEDVANPDIGFLKLSMPIDLSGYAEFVDVVARLEGGEKLTAAALVRSEQKPESPLAWSKDHPLSSTVEFGYEHGFGTPMFSKGGDSGAGLFLVENGVRTHKLIGVGRQPEPDRNLDHFTRVDAAFLKWFSTSAGSN